uniref:hypothetical protein n=1 Tax=Mariniflexile sp. TaxID=1979402 RepID=UPI0040486773
MKKNVLLLFIALFTFSCMNEDDFPQIENITKGEKWTLKIGSTYSQVYEQLQELNVERKFNTVNVTYRKPYSKPEEIQSDISLYNSISIETTSGVLERILITFGDNKVTYIEKGGGLLDYIQKWPENQPNNISINIDDSVDIIIEKLIYIYQIPIYQDYQIILPDKLLTKPYDSDMKNYDEWAFSFFEKISFNKDGRNTVRLYFKNNKLVKIKNTYEEFEIVY